MSLNEYYISLKNVDYNKHADQQVKKLLDLFKKNIPFGYARFNDGEMMGIDKIGAKAARGDQVVNESLHNALKEAIQYQQENYYIGMPCNNCFPRYTKLAQQLVKQPIVALYLTI